MFDQALNELLQHPDWAMWSEQLLPRYYYPPKDVAYVMEKHAPWYQELQERRTGERAAAKAAAAMAEARSEAAAAVAAGVEAAVAEPAMERVAEAAVEDVRVKGGVAAVAEVTTSEAAGVVQE